MPCYHWIPSRYLALWCITTLLGGTHWVLGSLANQFGCSLLQLERLNFTKEQCCLKLKETEVLSPALVEVLPYPKQCLSASLQQGRPIEVSPLTCQSCGSLDSDPGAIEAKDNSPMDFSKSCAGSRIAWVWDVWEVEELGKDLQKPQLFLHLWANALIYAQLHWQLVWLQLHLTSYIIKTNKNPPICLLRTCLRLGGCSCGQERGCVWRWTWGIVSALPKCPSGLFPVVFLVSLILAAVTYPSLPQPTSSLCSLAPTAPTRCPGSTLAQSYPMCTQHSLGFSLLKFQVPWGKKKKKKRNEKDEVWRY